MRIVLADDAALLREGLVSLLEAAGHEVVAKLDDADQLRSVVTRLGKNGELPDIVVTDVRMPPTNTDDGLKAAIDLRSMFPRLPIVVLSAYVASTYLHELIRGQGATGGIGYLLKERVGRVSDFLSSLEVVVDGGIVVDPEVLSRLVAGGEEERAESLPQLARLTAREGEVLQLMAEGLSNAQIAARLFISDGAVAKHVANVFMKLDLTPGEENRRVRAVLMWLKAHA